MRWALFYHSLESDWNHGNAHFLRGVASELLARRQSVQLYEPVDGWSRNNLRKYHGDEVVYGYRRFYPHLRSTSYDVQKLDLDRALENADVVLVHEWNDPEFVRRVGEHRRQRGDYVLLFHDTHHRSVTAPEEMKKYDLRHFDGVLVFGEVLRDIYLKRGWHSEVWTWHEAADVRVFFPRPAEKKEGDLVWVGNWGDGERTEELQQLLLKPIERLKLSATIHGVRYPRSGQEAVAAAGAQYRGWLPNYRVPELFSRFRMTVHIPRRPYRERLPGIPTIRVFEALACGIPLVSASWRDIEGLFRVGKDFLMARDGNEMEQNLRDVYHECELRKSLVRSGRETIYSRHTCRHRVDQLLKILSKYGVSSPTPSFKNPSSKVSSSISTESRTQI